MTEKKKGIMRQSGDLVGAYTHFKSYIAAVSVPLTAVIVWGIETFYKVVIPKEIAVALGMLLAGLGTAAANNAKSK